MTQVFKVYDDEYEDIVGVKQLSEHAYVQMESFVDETGYFEAEDKDELLTEELNYRLGSTDKIQEVKEILELYRQTKKLFPETLLSNFTVEQSKLALALRNFEVEELNVH